MDIPLFPLGHPLFPGGRFPLRIFEPRYVDMTKVCIRDDAVFGIVLIKAGFEVGQPAIPFELGCTARITEWEVPGAGLFSLVTRGETRFRIRRRWHQPDGLMRGEVDLIEPPDPLPLPDDYSHLQKLLRELAAQVGPEHLPQPTRWEDALWVAYRLSEWLPVTPERKQAVLELDEPRAVLAAVHRLLQGLSRGSG